MEKKSEQIKAFEVAAIGSMNSRQGDYDPNSNITYQLALDHDMSEFEEELADVDEEIAPETSTKEKKKNAVKQKTNYQPIPLRSSIVADINMIAMAYQSVYGKRMTKQQVIEEGLKLLKKKDPKVRRVMELIESEKQ